jgi:hypothetical protein
VKISSIEQPAQRGGLGSVRRMLPILLALSACTGAVSGTSKPGDTTGPNGAGGNGAGNNTGSGGGSGSPTAGSSGASGTGEMTVQCNGISPGPIPLVRRLTTYEYNNTVRDLLRDMTSPGSGLAPQVDSQQNTFGNDAANQFPTPLAIADYQTVAEGIAARATADSTALANLDSCASKLTAATEASCARTIAASLGSSAYRRVLTSAEVDELVAVYTNVRALSTTVTFGSGVAAMIEAMLQAPEFLYRVEQGTPVPGNPAVQRVTGREMATRLSYFFWQTMPDTKLFQAADSGMLDTNEGVQAQAQKMLDDPRSHQMVAFFFDNLLPIADLNGLTRNAALFPNWSSSIGAAMRSEVQRLLEYEIYENTTQAPGSPYAPGSWQAILTSPYTFVNEALFNFYGASNFAPGTTVKGTGFTKVDLNTSQRLGLLTLGGITAGNTISDIPSPVKRGGFVINNLMCKNITVPTGLAIKPPDPYSGKTARIRFGLHESQPVCASCHKLIDPLGFPFENYDAVGLYRTSEHWVDPNTQMAYDTPIDSSGGVLGVSGTAQNGIELVKLLATSPDIGACFAQNWMVFGYGRSLSLDTSAGTTPPPDACNKQTVLQQFAKTGFKVKDLLLAMTQSDGFLYRSAQ